MLHIDAMRFVASAGIVFFHAANQFSLNVNGLKLFVDLFFTLSGFVIADVYGERLGSARGYRKFLTARAAKLLPLHWLTLALWIGFALVGSRLGIKAAHPSEFDFHCIATNAALLHATPLGCDHLSWNMQSWSISAEMFMYLLAPLLLGLRGWALLVGFAAIAGMYVLTPYLSPRLANVAWYDWTAYGGVFRALPSFCLGVFLFNIKGRLRHIPAIVGWTLAALFVAGTALNINGLVLLFLIYALVAALIGADERGGAGKMASLIAPLGQLTYSSYMIHTLVLLTVVNFGADHFLHVTGAKRFAFGVTAFLAVWPLSYLSYVWFEEPAKRWLRNAMMPASWRRPSLAVHAAQKD